MCIHCEKADLKLHVGDLVKFTKLIEGKFLGTQYSTVSGTGDLWYAEEGDMFTVVGKVVNSRYHIDTAHRARPKAESKPCDDYQGFAEYKVIHKGKEWYLNSIWFIEPDPRDGKQAELKVISRDYNEEQERLNTYIDRETPAEKSERAARQKLAAIKVFIDEDMEVETVEELPLANMPIVDENGNPGALNPDYTHLFLKPGERIKIIKAEDMGDEFDGKVTVEYNNQVWHTLRTWLQWHTVEVK